jgi:hypothetical protein
MKNIELITVQEAKALVSKILELEPMWRERSSYYSEAGTVSTAYPEFYTIGSAVYLDGPSAHKDNDNNVISTNFSGIIDKVAKTLESVLDTKVFLDAEYSSPGFHIFRGREGMQFGTSYGGSIHIDTPHITAEFPFDFNIDKPITFTLVLQMPKEGGGMNYWLKDEVLEQISEGTDSTNISSLYDYLPMQFRAWVDINKKHEEYKVGTLYIHDGQTLHQVANEVPTTEEDLRITLQGHGVYRKEGLMIYL